MTRTLVSALVMAAAFAYSAHADEGGFNCAQVCTGSADEVRACEANRRAICSTGDDRRSSHDRAVCGLAAVSLKVQYDAATEAYHDQVRAYIDALEAEVKKTLPEHTITYDFIMSLSKEQVAAAAEQSKLVTEGRQTKQKALAEIERIVGPNLRTAAKNYDRKHDTKTPYCVYYDNAGQYISPAAFTGVNCDRSKGLVIELGLDGIQYTLGDRLNSASSYSYDEGVREGKGPIAPQHWTMLNAQMQIETGKNKIEPPEPLETWAAYQRSHTSAECQDTAYDPALDGEGRDDKSAPPSHASEPTRDSRGRDGSQTGAH